MAPDVTAREKHGRGPGLPQGDGGRLHGRDQAGADQKVSLQTGLGHRDQMQSADPVPDQRMGRGNRDTAILRRNGNRHARFDQGDGIINGIEPSHGPV